LPTTNLKNGVGGEEKTERGGGVGKKGGKAKLGCNSAGRKELRLPITRGEGKTEGKRVRSTDLKGEKHDSTGNNKRHIGGE